jgi:hypothetical protein
VSNGVPAEGVANSAESAEKVNACVEDRVAHGAAAHLARVECELGQERLIEALRAATAALAAAIQDHDDSVITVARVHVESLMKRIPHVRFSVPDGIDSVEIRFDGRPVQAASLSRTFSVNPGSHRVSARGVRDGKPVAWESSLEIAERSCVALVPFEASAPGRCDASGGTLRSSRE